MSNAAEDSDNPSMAVSPPLKWAGGKRWLIPVVAKYYRNFSAYRLVEPFVGGMAVTLGLQPKRALLNDSNKYLINFYSLLKTGLQVNLEMKNDSELYYQHRERFNQLIQENNTSGQELAELFYFLNRTCFNGLCRFNNKGGFNVPFGKYSKINYTRDFSHFRPVFQEWQFSSGDFANLEIAKDDFLYVDPPYDVEFTKYAKDDFTWNDQIRLVEWLVKFDNPMLVSNQSTERILKLYESAGFEVEELPAPRRIACTGDRTPAMEMLAYRNVIGGFNN